MTDVREQQSGLTRSTTGSAAWSYGSAVSMALLQVAVTAVLARHVAPSSFGLLAMAMLALRFGQYFAQFGLGQAIVQAREVDDGMIAASTYVSVALGALASVALSLLAPWVARLFHEPDVVPILRWMSLSFVTAGLSLTSLALLRRALKFRQIAISEFASYALGYGFVGITLAFMGMQVWALVSAALTQSALVAVFYYAGARHTLMPRGIKRGISRLAGFGSKVSLIGFMEFLASNLDTLAVGRYLGQVQLGFYSRGLNLGNQPFGMLSTGLTRVLLPALARLQDDRERLGRALGKVVTLFATISLPLGAGIAVAAPTLVAALLGPAWTPTVIVLRIVAIIAPLTALTHFVEVACEAVGALGVKAALRGGQIAVFGVLLLVGRGYGLPGFAIAFAASEFLHWAAYLMVQRRVFRISAGALVGAYRTGMVAAVVVALVLWGCEAALHPLIGPFLLLGIELVLASMVFALVILREGEGATWILIKATLADAGVLGVAAVARVVRLFDAIAGVRA